MDIELPGWFAKLLNLMGLAGAAGWTNARASGAHAVGAAYGTHADTMQPVVADLKNHTQRATGAVQGAAGTAMTEAINHPEGPVNNLADHQTGARVTALIAGGVVPAGLLAYQLFKLIDGAITAAQIAISAMIPGGLLAIAEELGLGRIMQNMIANGAFTLFSGA